MNAQPANSAAGAPPANPDDQLLSLVLKLRPDLKFDSRVEGGVKSIVIEDAVRNKFFQIGMSEFQVVSLVDGVKSVGAIGEQLSDAGDDEAPQRAKAVSQWLMQSNLVYCASIDNSSRLEIQSRSFKRSQLMGLLNPISVKLNLFNPNRLLSRLQPWSDWLFTKTMLAVWLILAAYAITLLVARWDDLGSASAGVLSGERWAWLLAIWLVLKVIHELAHGITCKRFGGDVPEAGVLFLLFTPMAFVNVTSMWRFANRWQRITVAAAGMYIELLISFLAIIVWDRSQGVTADVAFQVLLMASVTTVLFNANPLMRFDGYFILSDLLNIPNLYTKGTRWFGDRTKSLFFGIPLTANICNANELRPVACYGSLAFFWKISISVSLTIAASVLFHGAGIFLAAIGVVLWFGMPILQQYKTLFGPTATHQIDRKRTAISCSLLALFCLGMFTFFRAPATKSAPAIVQFSDELKIRAGADGFIHKILVADGAQVEQGDLLIELANPELTVEVEQLKRQAEEARIESRIHQQKGETSLALSKQEHYESLLEQSREKQRQADGLTVYAPMAGFVFARDLANLEGSFAKRGTTLLTLAKRRTKEIIVSIDQRDLDSIRGNEGQRLRVLMPGVAMFESRLTKIDPSATVQPTHESLCAHASGPLPVKAATGSDSQQQMVLLTPRFSAELEVDETTSTQLESGQRGRVFFAASSQSLGSYFFLAASDWLKIKLDQATQTAAF